MMFRTLLVATILTLTTPSLAEDAPAALASPPAGQTEECCKVCRKGKACGDTCIARDKTCRVGPGCACDG